MSLESSSPFYFLNNKLFCESVEIESFVQALPIRINRSNINGKCVYTDVPSTPTFVYSSASLKRNVDSYLTAIKKHNLNGILGYAVKANGNPHILKALKSHGVQMPITVSGNEVLASLAVGFLPEQILFNGNGKQEWEIKLAIEQGVLLNVDSFFDAKRIVSVAVNHFPTKEVKVILRIKPSAALSIPISVHPYVNTSESSKFGIDPDDVEKILDVLLQHDRINIQGLHCHLGSCMQDTGVFTYVCEFLNEISSTFKKRNIRIKIFDIGGGVGINYYCTPSGIGQNDIDSIDSLLKENNIKACEEKIPTIDEFIEAIIPFVPKDARILLEPGRSLVGNAGILVTKILGRKSAGRKIFQVVDASMAEIIRPCLYSAHHQIFPTKIAEGHKWDLHDVVGPICETGDFLGQNVALQAVDEDLSSVSNYLAVMDCGAYGSSMSSNYNMRPRPQEILVEGASWKCIRQRDSYEDLVSKYHL